VNNIIAWVLIAVIIVGLALCIAYNVVMRKEVIPIYTKSELMRR
jgi:TRAP-type C4-dicarboxylate transport system permease small subunit